MIRLRERLINPEAVIDIKRIPGLKDITFSKKDGLYDVYKRQTLPEVTMRSVPAEPMRVRTRAST